MFRAHVIQRLSGLCVPTDRFTRNEQVPVLATDGSCPVVVVVVVVVVEERSL